MSERDETVPLTGQERVWEKGWDDHRRQQMRRMAQLTLSQKLTWLEEAHRLVLHMQSEQIGSGNRG